MIGKVLSEILKEKGINVSELSNLTGINKQTLYSIVKRDNASISIEKLMIICKALGVSIERFYDDFLEDKEKIVLTKHEEKVIIAYRKQSEEARKIIDKIIDVTE